MNKCFLCGNEVLHLNTEMASDIYPDYADENDMLHYMKCTACGAEYEVYQHFKPSKGTPLKDEAELRKQML